MLHSRAIVVLGGIPSEVRLWAAAVSAAGGTVSPSRLEVASAFVKNTKASGVWDRTDDYWMLWGENAIQALTSLKQRRLAVATNSPTFTANRDYTFDGATNYIDTGFVPSTHGINYTGTSQRIAAYERTNVSSSGTTAGCRVGTSASIQIVARNGANMTGATSNTAGTVSFAISPQDSRGLKAISRAGGGTTALGYDRGVRLTDVTGLTVGTSPPSVSLCIGAFNSNGSLVTFRAGAVGMVSIGGPLSDAQELSDQNAVQAWATAIGAQV